MYRFISFLLCYFLTVSLWGQGWERVYAGKGQDVANALTLAPDGGFAMTGYYDFGQLYVLKTDADGQKQWGFTYLTDQRAEGKSIVTTRDGGFAIVGFIQTANGRDGFLLKVNAAGKMLWWRNLGIAGTEDEARSVMELIDGSLVIAGGRGDRGSAPGINQDLRIWKTDAAGAVVWTKDLGTADADEMANALTLASNGDILVAGESVETPFTKGYVARLQANNGGLIWSRLYTFPNNSTTLVRSITSDGKGNFVLAGITSSSTLTSGGLLMAIGGDGAATPLWTKIYPRSEFFGIVSDRRGGFFVSGYKNTSNAQADLYLVRADREGDILWETAVGRGASDIGNAVVATADGGAAAAGATQPYLLSPEELPYLVKTDGEGKVFTSYLSGKVFYDRNANCRLDVNEPSLEDWIVRIEGENFALYAAADAKGNFTLPVDTGSYRLTVYNSNNYWKTCQSQYTVRVKDFYSTASVQIPIQARYTCPRNEVNIATSLLRRCADNTYTVRYCNTGTAPSENTRIEVVLPNDLQYKSSSIAVAKREGNKFTFQVGKVDVGGCGNFTITGFLNCEALVGGAHCAEAHIYPDTICNTSAAWDGAVLRADARCKGDSVQLLARNVGSKQQTQTASYIVIETIVVLRTAPGSLGSQFTGLKPNEEKVLWQKEADGNTYRIIMDQSPGYPSETRPTAAVEGCKTQNTTNVSTGFYTMFPEDDGDPFISKDCQENNAATFNPTFLKRGHPKGYDAPHYVSPNTEMSYSIRFVNTTSDTVRQIIIRDTLSSALDALSARAGVGSHPFDFEVYGRGVVQFTLSNLTLLPGAEGYVRFFVKQQAAVRTGTRINNTAAVYMDYRPVSMTNNVFHTVEEESKYLVVKSQEVYLKGAEVRIAPNPFVQEATIEVVGVQAQQYRVEVYDLQGKLLFNQYSSHPTFRLLRQAMPSGAFFYRIAADGKPIASGKIVAQ